MNQEPHISHLLPVRRALAAAGLIACAGIAATLPEASGSTATATLVSAGSGVPHAVSSGF
ncbi:hypothetical protein [Rhodococcus sp. NPDC049939]|uniref:hypothetical protein n=1 Tax=Rhodococcus sp. NPDC049939 TaxID=3155511 RepID=UPI0033DBB7E8